jgi:hypothetical protein
MLLIGGIFVLFSGLMYFAFMAAWLGLFRVMGSLPWVTAAAGWLAAVMGAINVKDFFAFKAGVSLSIPESRKSDIFRRGREILAAGSLPAMLAATVLLAVAANFYELLCTAGFPMVYTRVLTMQVGQSGQASALSGPLQRSSTSCPCCSSSWPSRAPWAPASSASGRGAC